jgi:hypothetical protein
MSLVNIGGMPWFNQAAYRTTFMEAYDKAIAKAKPLLDVYDELYEQENTTDPTVYNSIMSAPPAMRPMKASHPHVGFTEQGMSVETIEYKAEFSLARRQLESTRGQVLFQRALNSVAAKAARFKADLIMDLIMGNAVCHDGLTYFNAAHVFEKSGAQSNTATTAFAAGAGYAAELPNFMAIADSQNQTIGTQPNVVIGALPLYPAMMVYFNPNQVWFERSGTAAGAMPITEMTKVAPIVRTVNNTPSATEWYMFQTEAGAKPFIIYQTEDPHVEVTSQDADMWKREHILMVMAKWTGIASYGPWFLAYRSNT